MEIPNVVSADWMPQALLIAGVIVVLYGIFLGVTKRAVFYNDYNDLGMSLAVFGGPLCLVLVFSQFNLLTRGTMIFIGALFVLLFVIELYRTWKANDHKMLITVIISVSKLTLSFLYVVYLAELTMGKGRFKRGRGLFMLVFLTPLMLVLVHSKEGSFRLTSRGRPTFVTSRTPQSSSSQVSSNASQAYKCPSCDTIAKSEQGLQRHIRAKHQNA